MNGNTITVSGNDTPNAVSIDATDAGGGSTVQNNRITGGGLGIEVDRPSSGYLTITGNTLDGCTTGIQFSQGSNMTVTGNTFARESYSSSTKGIRIESVFGSGTSTFSNNLFYNLGTGMDFGVDPSGNWTINHNIYDGAGSRSNKSFSQTAFCDTLEALFCQEREATVGQWTHRIDSQAAAGNNGWNQVVGAWGVQCGWGTLAHDATLRANETAIVLEDVIVPTGKTLTMGAGSELRFDEVDQSNVGTSSYTGYNELRVEGVLDVNGTSQSPVTFTSSAASPAAGDWFGLVVGDSTTDIAYADFRYAANAAVLEGGTITMDHATFQDTFDADVYVRDLGVDAATITNSTFTIGDGTGVFIDGPGVTLEDNTFTGNGDTDNGVHLYGEFGAVLIGNTIEGVSNGAAVKVGAGAPVLEQNVIQDNKWGIYLTGGATTIGDAGDSTSDNTITGNTRGIYSACVGGGTCPPCSTFSAVMRNSSITSNSTGVYVEKRGFINLGTAASGGKNTFSGNTYYCIRNGANCDTVRAVGNWWGAYPPVVCWQGKVDGTNPLAAAPASRRPEVVVVGPASALRVLGAWPNPTTGSATVRFETAGGGAAVRVEVFDVAGRLIRTIAYEARVPGVHEVRWDGRTGTGTPVPSGIYFVRVGDGARFTGTTRVLVTR